jgi:hypothetical protein
MTINERGDDMERKERETRGATEGCEQVMRETANVLLVGDSVNLNADQPGAAFGWATVVCVTEDAVELVRPYVHTSDFTTSGFIGQHIGSRVIDYIGQERITLPRHCKDRIYSVVFRTSVPR